MIKFPPWEGGLIGEMAGTSLANYFTSSFKLYFLLQTMISPLMAAIAVNLRIKDVENYVKCRLFSFFRF
jgi:hypothetical protein